MFCGKRQSLNEVMGTFNDCDDFVFSLDFEGSCSELLKLILWLKSIDFVFE